MIKQNVLEALNAQVNEELYSAYLYGAMRGWFEKKNLKGFANWMRIQTEEELFHVRKFMAFIFERGGELKLKAIKEPAGAWNATLDIFEAAYNHECHISECINKLSTLAVNEDDHATRVFLEWFVTEQLEEEANADEMVQNLKLMQDAPGGLFMLDREVGQRVLSPLVIASVSGQAAVA
jgi:ferritin